MNTQRVGIVMNGVTGRMGCNQHLIRSILAIINEGGVKVSPEHVLMPEPILTGRTESKLAAVAKQAEGIIGKPVKYTTDVEGAMQGKLGECDIFFDASATLQRARFVELAVKHNKPIYCEKPTAVKFEDASRLADMVEKAGIKNGVVQDKLFLPGIRKIKQLIDNGFFGRILSVRGEFGYWVFTGEVADQPIQRPSWNYRLADGGGIMVDMFCHWRYVIDNTFGPIDRLVSYANTDLPTRIDENGLAYKADADDSAYAIFILQDGTVCQFNSSWCTRVRRDDLLTIQVDGTKGSAVAGLRECLVQSESTTPKPVWNPDIVQPIDFYDGWQQMPAATNYDNAFKIQWEMFLRHVVLDEPWKYDLREGAKGVQLAELGIKSWQDKCWVSV